MNKAARQKLAILLACKRFLSAAGMIKESEGNAILARIMKFQDKYKIEITQEQLDSVHFKYED